MVLFGFYPFFEMLNCTLLANIFYALPNKKDQFGIDTNAKKATIGRFNSGCRFFKPK